MEVRSPLGKLPKWGSVGLMSLIGIGWLNYTFWGAKLVGIICSAVFSLIEYTWIGSTVELPDGNVSFRPFSENTRKPKTTKEQFFANLLLLPFIVPIYASLFNSSITRILFFPALLWVIEIIQGYTLMLIYGRNPAWCYTGKDAYCHGNIKLGYFPHWVIIGILFEFLFSQLLINLI